MILKYNAVGSALSNSSRHAPNSNVRVGRVRLGFEFEFEFEFGIEFGFEFDHF